MQHLKSTCDALAAALKKRKAKIASLRKEHAEMKKSLAMNKLEFSGLCEQEQALSVGIQDRLSQQQTQKRWRDKLTRLRVTKEKLSIEIEERGKMRSGP